MIEADVIAYGMQLGWRVSPLATALVFSTEEQEKPRFESAPHLEIVSNKIVDAVNGVGKKFIIVSMPPRHGKSTLISRRTPEWFLGQYPERMVGMCGYGSKFASGWGRMARNEMRRHYDRLGFTLAEDSKAANVWHTSEGGGMWTAGINGEITGKGADLLIIDDPIKNDQEAYSSTMRDSLWEWWQGTALTRTYPHSVIVVVMTRWHTDDFVGRLLSPEYDGDPDAWDVIDFPALWDKDTPDMFGRKKGDALWPSHFPAEWLISDRKNKMSPEKWISLYQQKPANTAGIGNVYHNFDDVINVRPSMRDDRLPICWSLDFNVNPMTSVVGQVREQFATNAYLTNEKLTTIEILKEICLPNSNTLEMCGEFLSVYGAINKNRKPEVHIYGDATANRRDTRGTESDWAQVYRFMTDNGIPYRNFVNKSNPLERDRVSSVNFALRSPDDVIGLYIDPSCRDLRLDLKEVRWKKDSAGNTTSTLDKSDAKRTHVSDALGYLVHAKFALLGGGGERQGQAR